MNDFKFWILVKEKKYEKYFSKTKDGEFIELNSETLSPIYSPDMFGQVVLEQKFSGKSKKVNYIAVKCSISFDDMSSLVESIAYQDEQVLQLNATVIRTCSY